MMFAALPLFADETVHIRFQWGRILALSDWMPPAAAWLLIGLVSAALLFFVVWLYTRDARELPPVLAVVLILLRLSAFLVLLVLFLEPQWRTEKEVVHNSQAVVLVDTSLSMGEKDDELPAADHGSRSERVVSALERSGFLDQLRKTHDVVLFRFDETLQRIASLPKGLPESADSGSSQRAGLSAESSPGDAAADPKSLDLADLRQKLQPSGRETRLGQALQRAISDQRNAPVAGIVVISDGCQNAGIPPETAIELAKEVKFPVYTVGVGSNRRPLRLLAYDLEAPQRAHPGDPYTVTGMIQSQGLAGQSATAQLYVKDPVKKTEQLAGSEQVILGADGEVTPVRFQVTPTETGKRQLSFRLQASRADRHPEDRHREADIEIVDRKTRVLLFAGGPMREYQFLRTLLYRDKSTTVDVLLQTAKAGISQEANKILDKFPETRDEMYAYDCVIALDPNWQALGAAQIDLLEGWVAEQGGGAILIAGPVYAGQAISGWVQDATMAKIRALYPVDFQRRFTVIERDTYIAQEPWPIDFTREGHEAEFLWLADTESANATAWASFAGVYSYQPVRGPKSGATVYARFSDPRAAAGNQQPVYMAGQFYGSGRTFYLGSAEMWRLRRQETGFFDQLYTRLIRHVSRGRLLRQSTRGTLAVDKEKHLVGSTVQIRAQLTNLQLQPLVVPSLALEMIDQNGKVQTVRLRPDPGRAGTYAGQFTGVQAGRCRLELPVPDSDNERLTREVEFRRPHLEQENVQRNDALLARLALETGGKYYQELDSALSPNATDPIAGRLKDRTKTSILIGKPSRTLEETFMKWAMFSLCGVLCLEWFIRRLSKLA